jgi:alpha-beta hydrolase superfamily lysophospholipase
MHDNPVLVARTILEVTRTVDSHRRNHMSADAQFRVEGGGGGIAAQRWDTQDPRRIVVLVHGIGEHSGRYDHVARRFADDGAVVYAHDHRGHGRSDGPPALIDDVDDLVDDLAIVVERARTEHPGLPVAMLGHSLGGIVATRFVQRRGDDLSALVLTAPVIGGNPDFEGLLAMDPMPDVPIDPAMLSRDPAVGEAYANDPLVYHGPLSRRTLASIFAAVDRIAEGPGLGSLPTLWVHGEEDPLAPLGVTRDAIERIRGDRLEEHIHPGARHEVLNEINREDILDEVASFLDAVTPRAAVA